MKSHVIIRMKDKRNEKKKNTKKIQKRQIHIHSDYSLLFIRQSHCVYLESSPIHTMCVRWETANGWLLLYFFVVIAFFWFVRLFGGFYLERVCACAFVLWNNWTWIKLRHKEFSMNPYYNNNERHGCFSPYEAHNEINLKTEQHKHTYSLALSISVSLSPPSQLYKTIQNHIYNKQNRSKKFNM